MGPADEPNPNIPAGFTYFGQFIDHDLTSRMNQDTIDVSDDENERTPQLDLDSLYGRGPNDAKTKTNHASFFNRNKGKETFKTGSPGNEDGDLFRDKDFKAQIVDERNDENIIIASIHLLMQKFHNKLVEIEGLSYEEAKKAVTYHYQSAILNNYLARIIGRLRVNRILSKAGGQRRIYRPEDQNPNDIFMPTEFAGACFRFGHSMVREEYNFNNIFDDTKTHPNLFFGFPGGRPCENIFGSHQITKIWTLQGNGNSLLRFFDPTIPIREGGADNLSGKIDTKLAQVLFNLEIKPGENNVLAHRNLLTGQNLELPSGQQTVDFMNNKGYNITPLQPEELGAIPEAMIENTPLWYYTLREAEVREGGDRLGDVGGFIVGETIIGILELDKNSFINQAASWPFYIKGKNQGDKEVVKFKDIIEYVG